MLLLICHNVYSSICNSPKSSQEGYQETGYGQVQIPHQHSICLSSPREAILKGYQEMCHQAGLERDQILQIPDLRIGSVPKPQHLLKLQCRNSMHPIPPLSNLLGIRTIEESFIYHQDPKALLVTTA